MILSLATKAFREDVCNNFKDDPVNTKLEEIKQRFQLQGLKKQRQNENDEDEEPRPTPVPETEEQKRNMQQAVKDLKNIYGNEVDSDEGVSDTDSDGLGELKRQSRTFEQDEDDDDAKKFNAFVRPK